MKYDKKMLDLKRDSNYLRRKETTEECVKLLYEGVENERKN